MRRVRREIDEQEGMAAHDQAEAVVPRIAHRAHRVRRELEHVIEHRRVTGEEDIAPVPA
jgi:hypothetical protein